MNLCKSCKTIICPICSVKIKHLQEIIRDRDIQIRGLEVILEEVKIENNQLKREQYETGLQ